VSLLEWEGGNGRWLIQVIEIQMELYKTAPYLEFLPLPKRIEGHELWKEGVERVKANDVVPRAPRPRPRCVNLLFFVC
jgi:hypothetical protein